MAGLSRQLLGRRLGVFSGMSAIPYVSEDGSLCHVSVQMGDHSTLPVGGRIDSGGGTHSTLEGACLRALMESVERYCAACVDYRRLVRSRPVPGGPFLFGKALPLYAPFQYETSGWPYRPLTRDSDIRWVDGRSLVTGRRHLVPAGLVYVPYDYDQLLDERLGPSTSTGMACSTSWAQANVTGLLEVCERDAFTIMWLNRISMPLLRVPEGSAFAEELDAMVADPTAAMTFVDLTNDFSVPVVCGVLKRELFGKPLVTIGLASRPGRVGAARKAAFEAISEYRRIRDILESPQPPFVPTKGFTNVSDFPWHGLVYADPALQPQLDFITASQEEHVLEDDDVSSEPAESRLQRYLQQIHACGGDALTISLTTREIQSMGLHVVKVMVPQAVPLNPHHLAPWLGHDRIFEVPVRLGYRSSRPALSDLNLDYPHPFA